MAGWIMLLKWYFFIIICGVKVILLYGLKADISKWNIAIAIGCRFKSDFINEISTNNRVRVGQRWLITIYKVF